MNRRIVSAAVGVAIAAVAVYFLLTPDVLREMRSVAVTASWPALTLAILLGGVIQWLRAWRFSIMTHGTLALPDWTLVRIAFKLNLLNFVLPFRLGELGYPVMMNRATGQSILGATGVLLLVRLFDLCTVAAIFVAMAAALRIAVAPGLSSILWIIAAALAIAPLALVLAAHPARKLIARLPNQRWAKALDLSLAALSAHRAQFAAIGLSFVIWLVFGGLAAIAAAAVTDGVRPAVAFLGAAAGNVAFALPINGIGGFGPSQAAWVAVVSQAGVGWSDAVISAFAVYTVTVVSALLFGGLAFLRGMRG